ncbi:hypothetical protein HPB51_019640 [Rhipicephalus microplus]|uniref:Uncharacterized protein n=1 Tax=Rhipicephalus microplus TaxID=6941 RepID=A0A9J6EBE1_RHIMP|nr:hypothetical protein HPB51_019640 [Rhipicephalus microplus]
MSRSVLDIATRFSQAHVRTRGRRYYQSRVEVAFTVESTLRDYTALLNETTSRYWLSKDNADYDARYHVSCLMPGHEYNAGKNVLHVPFGVVALQQRVAQSAIPAILIPYIVPHLVEGACMYEAIDVRGSTINVRGMPETWWSGETLVRYRQLQKCFTQNYLESIQRFGTFQASGVGESAKVSTSPYDILSVY